MTPDHMLIRITYYEEYLKARDIPKQRMHPAGTFGALSEEKLLEHAHYLCDTAKEYAQDPDKWAKANRHYTALQMCLSFAQRFTLEQIMEHNKHLPPGSIIDKKG